MTKIEEYEAVIFDMDGVLIDSEPLWKIAMEEVFSFIGCSLSKEDFQYTVGLRIDEVIDYWSNKIGWEKYTSKQVEELIEKRMVELITKNGKPLIGVIDTINFLKTKNKKIGLATSSSFVLIKAVLNTLGLEQKFDFVHSAEKEEYGKPNPSVYLSVSKHLTVSPLKCLVVEDSLNGIISGKAARMTVVCIPEKTHNPNPKLNLADYTFLSMQDFLEKIN